MNVKSTQGPEVLSLPAADGKTPFSWYLASWHPPCVDAMWIQKSCFKREMQNVCHTIYKGFRVQKGVIWEPQNADFKNAPCRQAERRVAPEAALEAWLPMWRSRHFELIGLHRWQVWSRRFWVSNVSVCKGEAAHRQRTGYKYIFIYMSIYMFSLFHPEWDRIIN